MDSSDLRAFPKAVANDAEEAKSIEQLLDAAKTGDAPALGELLTKYRNYLMVLARSQLHQNFRGKTDPSDVAQEVCLAAHANLDTFEGTSPQQFAAWLRGILSNVLATHIRKYLGTQMRDPRLEQSLQVGLSNASSFLQADLAADMTSPSAHVARNEAILKLAESIEALPEDYRQVIMMRHIDHTPFADIAAAMDRSVDSVEKLWVRGLVKLRKLMGDSE